MNNLTARDYSQYTLFDGAVRFAKNGDVRWPTLSKCWACGGYAAITWLRPPLIGQWRYWQHRKNPLEAYHIALMQQGWFLAKWDSNMMNRYHDISGPCECACEHEACETSYGLLEHEVTCKECGVSRRFDSSG